MIWSQNLDKHLLKQRVIIISADKANLHKAEAQFKLLNKEHKKLTDRKLIVYKCIDNTCTFYDFLKAPKTIRIHKEILGFRVALLGLDGGEKFNSNQVENADVFCSLIDRMPMRRQELRTQQKKNE